VLAAAGMGHLRYDYNLLNLEPVGLESVELEHKLFHQANQSAWFALSIADTPEQVAARKEAFLRLPSVERVVEIASKLPRDIAQKRPIIARISQRLANLPAEVPDLPVLSRVELDRLLAGAETMFTAAEMATAVHRLRQTIRQISEEECQRRIRQYQQGMAAGVLAKLQELRAAASAEPPQLADLPESVTARFVGRTGRYLMQVYGKANIWEVGPMGQFVADVRTVDPNATGNPVQVFEASRQMKASFQQAACYALLMIVPVVLLDFRRLSHTLLAALPMAVGLLQTLGLMGLLDIPLNQANMIVLPLTLGIGMESGINLVHELRCQRGRYRGAGNAVVVAVAVNSLTTMVGFGALMIANHRGLQSLGRVLTLAMGCCLLCSLLLPNLLLLGRFGEDAVESDDWDEDDGEDYGENWADGATDDDLPESRRDSDDADDRTGGTDEIEDEAAWPEDEASMAA
jgi:hypothetical protein